jgi:hypothetical protein
VLTSKVDGSTGTDSLGVVSLLQQSVDTTDGELQSWEGVSEGEKAEKDEDLPALDDRDADLVAGASED